MTMHQVMNAYLFGQIYGAVGPMALVSRSSSASFTDGAPITFNNEVYDSESVIAVTASAMTIPSAGCYRASAGFSLNLYEAQKFRKNGSNLLEGGFGGTSEAGSPAWNTGRGAIVQLAAADTIDFINQFSTGSYGVDGPEYTWFCLERIAQSPNYALTKKTANQTSFTSGNVSFDAEVADTNGWHDNASNNERLTVPSGVSRVRLIGNITTGSFSGAAEAVITKNGTADVVGLPGRRRSGSGNKLINLASPPINVSPGDYFAINAVLDSSSSILYNDYTWFTIEEVPASIKSCLVYNSAGHSLTTTDTYLNWDSEDHDPDGMHSTGSNTSRLTVPAGCSWARLTWHLKGQLNSTQRIWAQVKKNNAAVIGTAHDAETGASGKYQRLNGIGAWVAVSPGDYFELQARVNTGSLTTAGGWFAMECM